MTYVDHASLTWAEAERIAQQGDAIGLIPVAAIEQHGPHLPLSTDFLIATDMAKRIARSIVEPVVVATVVPGGLSSHHVEFPGTVDLPEEVFGGTITAYVEAFRRMGIRKVACFSGHGGNFGFLGQYQKQHEASGSDVTFIGYDSLPDYIEAMLAGAANGGIDPVPCDTHAGLVETSQILAIAPELVRGFDGLGGYVANEPGFIEKVLKDGLRSLSDTGILGAPTGATAVAGEAVQRAIATALTRWLCDGLGATATMDRRLENPVV